MSDSHECRCGGACGRCQELSAAGANALRGNNDLARARSMLNVAERLVALNERIATYSSFLGTRHGLKSLAKSLHDWNGTFIGPLMSEPSPQEQRAERMLTELLEEKRQLCTLAPNSAECTC